MRVTCDDCRFERATQDGDLEIWTVAIPIEARPLRVITDKLEEIAPGGGAQMTFQRGLLKSVLIF